ncbi:MAG: electron transfer flavoprotein beta subunit/FixA family protein [Candidatus Adiutrix sp.]|jgi:electron transfer flavoprotein beta subunit|nr:electron transfer flavoprotein beta subunit/FixA family protein [Candidatus Adiutrix sp.]
MAKIVACYKWVIDETDIRVKDDLSIDVSRAQRKLSDYDRNTIEAAVRAAKEAGAQAVGLTFGTDKIKPSLKEALSRGLTEVYWVASDKAESADGKITANILAAAIRTIKDVSVVLCTDGSSDSFARQTAPRIAAILGWPVVTGVRQLEIAGDAATVTQARENSWETLRAPLPAVFAVLPEINPAPIPGLMAIVSAAKKPNTELKAEDLGASFETNVRTAGAKGYAMDRKNIMFTEGAMADRVRELALALRKEGVL